MSGAKTVTKSHGRDNAFEAIFPGTSQVVSVTNGGSSTQSAATGSSTKMIRVVASAGCFIEIGSSPTATNSTSMFIPASVVCLFGITGGHKVAVKDNAANASVYITEAISV